MAPPAVLRRRALDAVVHRVGASRVDPRQTVVVSGSPRTGTNWLAETLAASLRGNLTDEPLSLTSAPAAATAGFEWRTWLDPHQSDPVKRAYLAEVLAGVRGSPRAVGAGSRLRRTLTQRRLVVRFVRANRMLAWMSRQFPATPMVLLTRHPCAVVASQLQRGAREGLHAWRRETGLPPGDDTTAWTGGTLPDALSEHVRTARSHIRSRAGVLALIWALDQVIPLVHTPPPSLTTVAYEDLATDFATVTAKLRARLGDTDDTAGASSCPSRSAGVGLRTDAPGHQLAKWREQLTAGEAAEVLAVVRAVGVDGYDERPGPPDWRFAGERIQPVTQARD